MAYEIPTLNFTLEAAADLSAKQYFFVKVDANGKAALCAAATDKPVGVLQNKPESGESAEIMALGISKVSSDAALNEADLIGTSADGQADAKVPGTDTTEYIVGQMLTATSAANAYGSALINCCSPARAA